MHKSNRTILALYPNSKGVGYAMFDSPDHLVEYGIGNVSPVSITRSLKKVQRYIAYYQPDIVITRELTPSRLRRSRRTQRLISLICSEARLHSLNVHCYTRKDIQETFKQFGATSKFQISKKLMEWFPMLENLEYPKRKRWMSEHYNTGIFDAIALGVVYFYRE